MGILIVAGVVWLVWLIQRQRYYHRWKQGLEVQLSFANDYLSQGDSSKLEISVINRKKMTLPCIGLKFKTSRYLKFEDALETSVSDYFYRHDILTVGSYQQVIRRLEFTANHRGLYTIDEVEAVCHDAFFTQTFLEILPMNALVCVYPTYVDIHKIFPLLKNGTGELVTRRRLFEDPFTMEGIREYTPNDRMKNIHWKASARTGTLQVTVPQYTTSQKMWVVLAGTPCGRGQNYLEQEEEIKLAYSFCEFISRKEIPFSLLTNYTVHGEEAPYSQANGMGRVHLQKIQENMARLDNEISPVSSNEIFRKLYKNAKAGEFVVVISANQRQEQQKMIEDGVREGIEMTWVIPCVRTSDYRENMRVQPELLPYSFIWQYDLN